MLNNDLYYRRQKGIKCCIECVEPGVCLIYTETHLAGLLIILKALFIYHPNKQRPLMWRVAGGNCYTCIHACIYIFFYYILQKRQYPEVIITVFKSQFLLWHVIHLCNEVKWKQRTNVFPIVVYFIVQWSGCWLIKASMGLVAGGGVAWGWEGPTP